MDLYSWILNTHSRHKFDVYFHAPINVYTKTFKLHTHTHTLMHHVHTHTLFSPRYVSLSPPFDARYMFISVGNTLFSSNSSKALNFWKWHKTRTEHMSHWLALETKYNTCHVGLHISCQLDKKYNIPHWLHISCLLETKYYTCHVNFHSSYKLETRNNTC